MTDTIDVELSVKDWAEAFAPTFSAESLATIPAPDRSRILGIVIAFLESRATQVRVDPGSKDPNRLGSSAPLLLGNSRYFIRMKKTLFEVVSQATVVLLSQLVSGATNSAADLVALSAAAIKAFLENFERLSPPDQELLVAIAEEARTSSFAPTLDSLSKRLGRDATTLERMLKDLELRSIVASDADGWRIVF